MDTKSRGITWVGSLYQKIEAICEEVDSFINKDKVMYEDTHSQSDPDSEKKFRKGFMKNVLPSESSFKLPFSNSSTYAKSEAALPSHEYSFAEKLDGSISISSTSANSKGKVPKQECSNFEKVQGSLSESSVSIDSKATVHTQVHSFMGKLDSSVSISSTSSISEVTTPTLEDSISDKLDDSVVSSTISPNSEAIISTSEYSTSYGCSIGKIYMEACDKTIQFSVPLDETPINKISAHAEAKGENFTDEAIGDVDCLVTKMHELSLPVVLSNAVAKGIMPLSCERETNVTGDIHKEHNKTECSASLSESEFQICAAAIPQMNIPVDFNPENASISFGLSGQSKVNISDFEDVKLSDYDLDFQNLRDEIFFIYQQSRKKRSRKKKLQDAITSRLNPKKKEDYEQLADWFAHSKATKSGG